MKIDQEELFSRALINLLQPTEGVFIQMADGRKFGIMCQKRGPHEYGIVLLDAEHFKEFIHGNRFWYHEGEIQ